MLFLTSDNGLSYAAKTRETKHAYCERNGYEFHAETFAKDVNPYWEQVRVIRDALVLCEENEWLNYTGADAYIVDGAAPCEHLLDEDYDLIISTDNNGLNNNGFFLKNSEWGRTFIENVWAMKSDDRISVPDTGDGLVIGQHQWYEQAAFILVIRAMGYGHVKIIPKNEINAYPWDKEQGTFIVHLPGRSEAQRENYFAQLFGESGTQEERRRLVWLERKAKIYIDESERIQLEALRRKCSV